MCTFDTLSLSHPPRASMFIFYSIKPLCSQCTYWFMRFSHVERLFLFALVHFNSASCILTWSTNPLRLFKGAFNMRDWNLLFLFKWKAVHDSSPPSGPSAVILSHVSRSFSLNCECSGREHDVFSNRIQLWCVCSLSFYGVWHMYVGQVASSAFE